MIRCKCKNCGYEIKTYDKLAGKRVRCPKCKEPVQIPQSEGGRSPKGTNIIKFRCPNCNQKIGLPPKYAGKMVRCAKCEHRLRVPQAPGAAAKPKPQDELAAQRVGQEQPVADEGGIPGLGDMSELLQLEASAPAIEEPLQLSPVEDTGGEGEPGVYASQFPARPSFQVGAAEERKKSKPLVPIIIVVVCFLGGVIGYVAVKSFMGALEPVESQADANYDEAQQFTKDYIALLADGNIEAAIEKLSPDVKATTANEQIETLAKQIGTSEILEMKLGPTNYEQDLAAKHYYLWYTLDYERDVAIFIASVRQVDAGFTIDGIATGGSLGPSVVIGPLTEQELSQKAMEGRLSEVEDIGAIGALFAKSFCGMMVVILIIVLIQIIAMWVLFEKAGRPGWAAIVPFYSMWVLAEVGDKSGWMGLAMCFCGAIPVVGNMLQLILWVTISLGVARTFDRGVGFGIGLSVVPFVFYPILAFSRD
jgi:hypothetical protein